MSSTKLLIFSPHLQIFNAAGPPTRVHVQGTRRRAGRRKAGKGLELANNCGAMLKWHELLTAKAGQGTLMRAMADTRSV